MSNMEKLLQAVRAYNQKLNDPDGDGTGNGSRAPNGDDYNEIMDLIDGYSSEEPAKPTQVMIHTGCGGELGFDAYINSNGEVNGGPFDDTTCMRCGEEVGYNDRDEGIPVVDEEVEGVEIP